MRLAPLARDTLEVSLQPGETVKAESNAIVAMDASLRLAGRMEGGIISALFRKFLTNESVFFQTLRAEYGPGQALMAPIVPGDVVVEELDGTNGFYLQRGAFLACGNSVTITSRIQRNVFNSLFSGTGWFLLNATGTGPLAFGAYGSVHKLELKPGEVRMVDNGHLVAWTQSMSYRVELAVPGSLSDSFFSGEGLMCYFTGPGTVFVQSRSEAAFREWIKTPSSGRKSSSCCTTSGLIALLFFFFALASTLIFPALFSFAADLERALTNN
eukprot:m.303524 g.303524  ORF g.303524 m.303524 type:complete len:270 (-) comp15973_c0_seq1:35-844(-)